MQEDVVGWLGAMQRPFDKLHVYCKGPLDGEPDITTGNNSIGGAGAGAGAGTSSSGGGGGGSGSDGSSGAAAGGVSSGTIAVALGSAYPLPVSLCDFEGLGVDHQLPRGTLAQVDDQPLP